MADDNLILVESTNQRATFDEQFALMEKKIIQNFEEFYRQLDVCIAKFIAKAESIVKAYDAKAKAKDAKANDRTFSSFPAKNINCNNDRIPAESASKRMKENIDVGLLADIKGKDQVKNIEKCQKSYCMNPVESVSKRMKENPDASVLADNKIINCKKTQEMIPVESASMRMKENTDASLVALKKMEYRFEERFQKMEDNIRKIEERWANETPAVSLRVLCKLIPADVVKSALDQSNVSEDDFKRFTPKNFRAEFPNRFKEILGRVTPCSAFESLDASKIEVFLTRRICKYWNDHRCHLMHGNVKSRKEMERQAIEEINALFGCDGKDTLAKEKVIAVENQSQALTLAHEAKHTEVIKPAMIEPPEPKNNKVVDVKNQAIIEVYEPKKSKTVEVKPQPKVELQNNKVVKQALVEVHEPQNIIEVKNQVKDNEVMRPVL